MTYFPVLSGRRVLTAAAGLVIALACSTPTYHFVKETVEHCKNHKADVELGESDLDCGGTECHGCTYGQRCSDSSDCADGECISGFCQEPGCENSALDGDETGIDCGGGCKPCRDGQPCAVSADCQSKVCGDDTLCASATCQDGVRNSDELDVDCGGSFCDGCGIGSPCVEAADCQSSLCDDKTQTCAINCGKGTDDCNLDPEDACETNLLTSADDCGTCGHVCQLPHAAAACSGGTCQIDTCTDPWIRCNTDDDDGCEVNASSDIGNCGGCGMVCPDLHGTPSCVSSKCAIDCDDNFGDCDDDPLTGCEASVIDVENCGECGKKCPSSGGTPFCVDGKCGLTMCDSGKGDCDGDDVCETSLDDDPNNCGRCGHICSVANGTAKCVAGACVIDECESGWENCDTFEEDTGFATGCETNITSDVKNCGACDRRCDMVDHGTGSCQAGDCALDCDNGFEDCDGSIESGCETNTTSDADHCGGCANNCNIPNAVSACVDSNCDIGMCLANYDDCNAAAGCETNVSNSEQHCGSCSGTCSSAGATDVSCSGGECDAPTCDATHGNCDTKNENGCEADITTTSNCGGCGKVCGAATPSCVLTGTTYKCQARITIANATPYPTAQVAGTTLTFQALPHAGNNRLLLLAIASESQNSGIAGARPDSVKFGTTNMVAGPEQAGVVDWWSPDLFIYYLALGNATADEASVTVTIDGSTAPQVNGFIAQALQLNGVRQTNPFTGSIGANVGTPDPVDPPTTTVTVPVTISGSAIYSFGAAMWMDGVNCTPGTPAGGCPAWSVSPSTNLTVTETWSPPVLSIGGTATRAFGMFINATSASLPAVGNYVPSWVLSYGGRLTHLAVAIAPAP